MGTQSYADVVEGVRATIATYTHTLDDGRTDDIVATFCPDGVSVMPGLGTYAGHDELRAAYAQWVPRVPQRHVVTNTHVTEWSDDEATALSDLVFMVKSERGWSIQLVGRYHDTLHRDGDRWRFHRREADFVT